MIRRRPDGSSPTRVRVGTAFALVFAMTGCVTAVGSREFRFSSNRKPEEARACAVSVLRRYGFRVVPDTIAADTAPALATPTDTTPADTARADTARADTARADTIRADTIRADTARVDTARADTTRAERTRADSTRADSTPARTARAAPAGPTPADVTRTTVLIRPPTASAVEPDRWWRAELSIGYDDQERTQVTSVLGSSRHRDGPFGAPSEALDDVGSDITARCTW